MNALAFMALCCPLIAGDMKSLLAELINRQSLYVAQTNRLRVASQPGSEKRPAGIDALRNTANLPLNKWLPVLAWRKPIDLLICITGR